MNKSSFVLYIWGSFLYCANFRYSEGEIRFNLMAIVSDRKMIYERKIDELQAQLTEVSDFNRKTIEVACTNDKKIHSPST